MISCILLSAGESMRFGSPKALANLDHQILIERQQKMLLSSAVDEIVIVLGAHLEQIQPHIQNHKKTKTVYNKDYKLGQTSSFKTGLSRALPQAMGYMLFPVDYPFIQQKTIDDLIAYFLKEQPLILIPAYQSHRGHPPIFSAKLKTEILGLDPSLGLNEILHRHEQDCRMFSLQDEGVVSTFNTPQEFQLLQNKFKD